MVARGGILEPEFSSLEEYLGRVQRAVLMAGYELGGRLSPFQPVWNRERFRAPCDSCPAIEHFPGLLLSTIKIVNLWRIAKSRCGRFGGDVALRPA